MLSVYNVAQRLKNNNEKVASLDPGIMIVYKYARRSSFNNELSYKSLTVYSLHRHTTI